MQQVDSNCSGGLRETEGQLAEATVSYAKFFINPASFGSPGVKDRACTIRGEARFEELPCCRLLHLLMSRTL